MANFSSSTKTNCFHFIHFIHTYSPVYGFRSPVDNYLYFGVFGKWKFKFQIPIYHKLHMKAMSNIAMLLLFCDVVVVVYNLYSVYCCDPYQLLLYGELWSSGMNDIIIIVTTTTNMYYSCKTEMNNYQTTTTKTPTTNNYNK